MREILFKAIRKDNGKWIEGFYLKNGKSFIYKPSKDLYLLVQKEVIPETLCQYTGFKDKNGNKVFIGDTLQYKNEKFVIRESRMGWLMYSNDKHSTTMYIHKYEIIGNKHDKEESKWNH